MSDQACLAVMGPNVFKNLTEVVFILDVIFKVNRCLQLLQSKSLELLTVCIT